MAGKLPFEPLAGLVILAGGTMPIPAGLIDIIGLFTLQALVDGFAGSLGSALIDGLEALFGDGAFKEIDALGTIRSGRSRLSNPWSNPFIVVLMMRQASSVPLLVRWKWTMVVSRLKCPGCL
jgi:hypothetical protein